MKGPPAGSWGGIGLVGLLMANLPLAGVLGMAAWLRETPLFWRNEGGYPIWLRDWVLVGFPPLLAVDVLFLAVATLALVRGWRQWMQGIRVGCVLLALQWIWFAGVAVLLVANNVDNLMEGRPIHWKPQ